MAHYRYNDAGQTRSMRGGYCGVRALCIATGLSWGDAERHLRPHITRGKGLSRGIHKADYSAALAALGYTWHSAPRFIGRKARCGDMPRGTIIARMAGHYCAVIDGTCNDIWDCSDKMIYGYWALDTSAAIATT